MLPRSEPAPWREKPVAPKPSPVLTQGGWSRAWPSGRKKHVEWDAMRGFEAGLAAGNTLGFLGRSW